MAAADDLEDWDPKTGTVIPKRVTPKVPAGSARQGIPVREISPSDINLGGGSRMIGRTPTYQKGGKVMSKERSQANYCKGGKVISAKSW